MFNRKTQLHCSTANPGTAGKNGRPGQAAAFRKSTTNHDKAFYHIIYNITHQDLAGGDDAYDADYNKAVNFVMAIMGRTFPGDTVFESVIDVKEQNRTQDIMDEITYRIPYYR